MAETSSSSDTVDAETSTSGSFEDVYVLTEGNTSSPNDKSLPTLPRECDRYGVSNTVGAAIYSSNTCRLWTLYWR